MSFLPTGIGNTVAVLIDVPTALAGDHAPRTAGMLARVSHGVAELPDFANQLLQNHEAIVGAVNTFAQEASPELLVAMIANMPADVHRMQDEVNPGTAPQEADGPGEAASICIEQGLDAGASESKYCRYATGFYLGYGAFTAVELASGAKALVKGVRKAGDLAKKIKDAADDIGSIKGALKAGKASLAETMSRQVVAADGGSPNIDGPAVREALDDLGADTASAKTTAIKALHSVDDGAADLGKLSSREQAKVASRLYRTGNTDDAIEFAKQLEDAEDLRYLAEEDVGTLEQLADWQQNPSKYEYFDNDVTPSDYIHLSKNSNVGEVHTVVRGSSNLQARGEIQWLETGDANTGMEKIVEKHADEFLDGRDASPEEIKDWTYRSIKSPDKITENPGGGTRYYKRVDRIDDPLRVSVSNNGYVLSVHPDTDAPDLDT